MLSPARSSGPELYHLTLFRHQNDTRHPNKQSVLDDTRHLAQRTRQGGRVGNSVEVAVEDVMTFVGEVRFPGWILPAHHLGAQASNSLRDQRFGETDHFEGQGKPSQKIDLL